MFLMEKFLNNNVLKDQKVKPVFLPFQIIIVENIYGRSTFYSLGNFIYNG